MAWVLAGIVRQIPADDVWKILGLLADNSAGATWKANHGLIKTAFHVEEDDPKVARDRAVAGSRRLPTKRASGATPSR